MPGASIDRFIRRQQWTDPLAEVLQKAVGAIFKGLGPSGRLLKNLLHGTYVLGHPLHPAVTDVPLGAWTVGVLADWLYVATGRVPPIAGDLALAVGVATGLFAALTGLTDHHETYGQERRAATLHGVMMSLVIVLELASLGMRVWAPA